MEIEQKIEKLEIALEAFEEETKNKRFASNVKFYINFATNDKENFELYLSHAKDEIREKIGELEAMERNGEEIPFKEAYTFLLKNFEKF